jgi:hypothetical protein
MSQENFAQREIIQAGKSNEDTTRHGRFLTRGKLAVDA